jgi:hypothetical protein
MIPKHGDQPREKPVHPGWCRVGRISCKRGRRARSFTFAAVLLMLRFQQFQQPVELAEVRDDQVGAGAD